MYPDLSYFFHDFFGTEVDNWTSMFKTFGVFLALTFYSAYILIRKELKRKEEEGLISKLIVESKGNKLFSETIFNALFGFILGWKIPHIYKNFADFKNDPASVIFTMEGNIVIGILIATLLGVYFYMDIKNRPQHPKGTKLSFGAHQKTGNIILVAALAGLIGSRFMSIIENWDSFVADPLGQLLSGSGLTIFGGYILATFAIILYTRKIGIGTGHMADVAAPALLFGYGVGRMGCQFSGDGDWGIANTAAKPDWFIFPDWAWAYDYPRNVADLYQRGEKMADCVGNFCTHLNPPVYPTPIYEIIISFILFIFVWSIRKKIKTPGRLFFIYLIVSGFSRFFVEIIRVNPRYHLFGLNWSASQTLSASIVVIGIIGIIFFGNKGSKNNYAIPNIDEVKPST